MPPGRFVGPIPSRSSVCTLPTIASCQAQTIAWRARGVYILLTPIHTYDPAFADQANKPSANSGFSRYFPREEMGTNPKSIGAQVNYIKQLLNHVNRYTGVALKDEPAILFVEMINEPVHHPENLQGSIASINAHGRAVRGTG